MGENLKQAMHTGTVNNVLSVNLEMCFMWYNLTGFIQVTNINLYDWIMFHMISQSNSIRLHVFTFYSASTEDPECFFCAFGIGIVQTKSDTQC